MKNLTLIDTAWKQRGGYLPTPEERVIQLEPITPENRDAKRIIRDAIQSRNHIDVSAEESAQAQAIYDANKIEGAVLIAADISLPDGHGIINCRVNGEHKQVRF